MSKRTRRQLLKSLPALAVASRGFSQAALIRVRSLNHFGIAVSDPKRSMDFYQGLFGMPVAARSEGLTIMRVGAGPQFVSIRPVEPGASPRITHYCLGVEAFENDRLLAALALHGVLKSDSIGPMKATVETRDSGRLETCYSAIRTAFNANSRTSAIAAGLAHLAICVARPSHRRRRG